jgi:hypothetical protein
MTPLQKSAWNKAIRDSVDALLHKGGYNEELSAWHQLAMMNFDVESEKSQAVEPIGYVRHADKTFWPHPECAVYASVSPSLAPVYAHPAQTPAIKQSLTVAEQSAKFDAGMIVHDDVPHPDALLMAAAPDLLAALQGVLRVADRATVEFDAARAAIARCTPQPPVPPTLHQ